MLPVICPRSVRFPFVVHTCMNTRIRIFNGADTYLGDRRWDCILLSRVAIPRRSWPFTCPFFIDSARY